MGSTVFMLRRLMFVVIVSLVAGCGSGDRSLADVDPDAVPADPTFDDVFAIIDRECVPCHGPTDPDLSDCEELVDEQDDVWEEIVGNSMPPGAWPRLTSEEKLLIERWIRNGAPAPCD